MMAHQQIDGGRQVKSASITGTQLAASTVADSNLATSYIKADGTRAFTGTVDAGTHKVINQVDGTAATDSATWGQVQGLLNGKVWKDAVRVATTANGTLATAYANGQVVDGVTLATGNDILLKDQTAGSENGIYTVQASGSPVRRGDANTSALMVPNTTLWVQEGTVNADTEWTLTNNTGIVLGTTALTFTQSNGSGAVTAGAGLTKTGNTLDVVAGDASLLVNADEVHVQLKDASLETVAGGMRVKAGTSGQVYIASAGGVLTPVTLSGDATVTAAGVLTLATTVLKQANQIVREAVAGTKDGANATFTLANTPIAGTEMIYLNGQLMLPGAGNDYTISGLTITWLTPMPISTDTLVANYSK